MTGFHMVYLHYALSHTSLSLSLSLSPDVITAPLFVIVQALLDTRPPAW